MIIYNKVWFIFYYIGKVLFWLVKSILILRFSNIKHSWMDVLKKQFKNIFLLLIMSKYNWYLYQGVSFISVTYTHTLDSLMISIFCETWTFNFPTIQTFFQLRKIKINKKTGKMSNKLNLLKMIMYIDIINLQLFFLTFLFMSVDVRKRTTYS